MNPLVFAGSLVGVLAIAGLVLWLGLGRSGRIEGAGRLAEELLADFEAAEVFEDLAGKSALVRGMDGSWALLRLQGNHPVVRRYPVLPKHERLACGIRIATGERLFGDVTIVNDRLLTLL